MSRRAFTRSSRGANSQTLATVLLAQVLLLFSGIIAARALGSDDRGALAIIWIVPFAFAFLGGLGLPQATAYFVARAGAAVSSTVRLVARIALFQVAVLTPLYGLVYLLAIEPSYPETEVAGIISLGSVGALVGQSTGLAVLQGQQRFTAFNACRLVPPGLYTVSISVLYLTGSDSLERITLALVGSWLLSAALTWSLALAGSRGPGSDRPPAVRRILSFGVRGVIGSVSPVDDLRVDQMLVGFAAGAQPLGLYVAAASFANLPKFIAQSVGLVAYPRIASAPGAVEAWQISRRTLIRGSVLVVVAVVGLMAVVPFILPVLYGSEFEDSVPLAETLLVATVFLGVRRLIGEVARGLGRPGIGSIGEIASILVLALSLILISGGDPSAQDVAWSVVIASFASAVVVSVLLLSTKRSSRPRPDDLE